MVAFHQSTSSILFKITVQASGHEISHVQYHNKGKLIARHARTSENDCHSRTRAHKWAGHIVRVPSVTKSCDQKR